MTVGRVSPGNCDPLIKLQRPTPVASLTSINPTATSRPVPSRRTGMISTPPPWILAKPRLTQSASTEDEQHDEDDDNDDDDCLDRH
jgi:hypothetical protein